MFPKITSSAPAISQIQKYLFSPPLIISNLFHSAQVSLYEVYIALRKFGPVIQCTGRRKYYFELTETEQTEWLHRQTILKCGAKDIPVHSRQRASFRRQRLSQVTSTTSNHYDSNALNNHQQQMFLPVVQKTSILDALNDDCLREIFEKSVLDTNDLYALARTCNQFASVTGISFRRRYRGEWPLMMYANEWPFHRCEVLFRQFGHCITSLKLFEPEVSGGYEEIVLGMIGYHCRTIESLHCHQLKPIHQAIEHYKRRRCHGATDGQAPFGQLKRLVYDGKLRPGKSIPNMQLPSLENFQLRYVDSLDTVGFFATNRQLKHLTLSSTSVRVHLDEMMAHLIELEELTIDGCMWITDDDDQIHYEDYISFGRLKGLKAFSFIYTNLDVQAILLALCNGQVRLERFKLAGEMFPATITRMPFIKHFDYQFFGMVTQPLVDYLLGRSELESLRLSLNYIEFSTIYDVLRHAKKLKVAEFQFRVELVSSAFILEQQWMIEAIDRFVKSQDIQLLVEVQVERSMQQTADVVELLNRCGSWLRIWNRYMY